MQTDEQLTKRMIIMNTLTQKMTKTLTAIAFTLSTVGVANAATKVVAADDYITSKICVAAAGDNRTKLNSAIKDSGLRKKYVVENVKCNDQNILAFVQEFGDAPEKMNNSLTNGKYTTHVRITDLASN